MAYNSQVKMKTHNVCQKTTQVNCNENIIWESHLRQKMLIFFLFFSLTHFPIPVVLL